VGDSVLAEWNGMWLDARIKEMNGPDFTVAYALRDCAWEDRVTSDRISSSISNIFSRSIRSTSRGNDSSELTSESRRHVNANRRSREFISKPAGDTRSSSNSVLPINVAGKVFLSSRLKDGRLIYMDPEKGIVMWSIPVEKFADLPMADRPQVENEKLEQTAENPAAIPDGFIARKDLVGNIYYLNTVSGKSQYERPTKSGKVVAENMKSVDRTDPKEMAPWEAFYDADGVPFYHNTETGAVSRAIVDDKPNHTPTEEIKQSVSQVLVDNIALPEGWEIHYTDDGFPYYYCQATGESHWELPASTDESWWETPEQSAPAVRKSVA
jgi:outer membrane protein assembly factor BamB